MKHLSLFAVACLMSLSMMAETARINPTWEGNYRTNNAEPTGWTKVTTSDAQFEVKNGARFFVVQTWTIANISQVDSLTFVYERVAGQTNNGAIAMWGFPYNSMVTSTANFDTDGMAFLNDVQTVLGVYPGNDIDADHAPFHVSEERDSIEGVHCRVFALNREQIDSLAALGTVENDYLTVNILLNTRTTAEMNYKFYHSGDAASYCAVEYVGEIEVPTILNQMTKAAYDSLALAVEEANDGDVLVINEDVEIAGARLEITKNLTIMGATGAEKILCNVPANTLMVLANGNEEDYTVSFKNLIVDGQDVVRGTQTFDSNGKAKLSFESVSVINTTYSVVTGDVKSNGSNVILAGNNSFPNGIYLNKNKRIDHQGATHVEPIRIILSADYVADYAIVLHCNDSTLYMAVDAADVADWELYVSNNQELKGRKTVREIDPQTITNCAAAAKAALSVSENNELFADSMVFNIEGYVTAIQTEWSSQYNNISFWMADSVNGGKVLQAFRAVCASADDAVLVGDKVKVTGCLTRYGTTPEFAAACTYEFISKVERPEPVEPQNLGEKTIAEFLLLQNTVDTCILTGVVDSIANTQYGNLYLSDETAQVFVYGVLTADGQSKQFESLNVEVGDQLTILALYSEYNGTPQVKNAIFVAVEKAEPQAVSYTQTESQTVKMLINGRIVIRQGNQWYDVTGRQL